MRDYKFRHSCNIFVTRSHLKEKICEAPRLIANVSNFLLETIEMEMNLTQCRWSTIPLKQFFIILVSSDYIVV